MKELPFDKLRKGVKAPQPEGDKVELKSNSSGARGEDFGLRISDFGFKRMVRSKEKERKTGRKEDWKGRISDCVFRIVGCSLNWDVKRGGKSKGIRSIVKGKYKNYWPSF